MTAAKNVYALMLALVIVLSGCFGNTADDTDAQEPSDSAVAWFSTGGVIDTEWSLPNEESPSGTPAFIECENLTQVGDFVMTQLSEDYSNHEQYYHNLSAMGRFSSTLFPIATCDIPVVVIVTNPEFMLVVHESVGVSINTTCGNFFTGEVAHTSGLSGQSGEQFAHGSSLKCLHVFSHDNVYASGQGYGEGGPTLWSLTYSLRTVMSIAAGPPL
jgi:hypothetical protein